MLRLVPPPRRLLAERAYDPAAYRNRNAIERMCCRIKDVRRIATRYDKRADNVLSAVLPAAAITWWTTIESRA